MKATVIISFYNNIEWLKLVFAGLSRQTHNAFDVIISDDGSNQEAVHQLNRLRTDYPFKITHVWHADNGWQKNIILNKSITTAQSEYLIFIDGDCIPHRHFVKEHLQSRKLNTLLAGRRVNLPLSVTQKVTQHKINKGYLELRGLFWSWMAQIRKKSSHNENGIYIGNKWLRSYLNKKDKGVLGSNFSIHKSDLLAVNGFDERYKLPAVGEDTDLELRLRNHGVQIQAVKHLAIQYHLYHKTLPRDPRNLKIYHENRDLKIAYTAHGILQDRLIIK